MDVGKARHVPLRQYVACERTEQPTGVAEAVYCTLQREPRREAGAISDVKLAVVIGRRVDGEDKSFEASVPRPRYGDQSSL